MNCIYNIGWPSKCSMLNEDEEPNVDLGCDKKGNCMVEDDECPEDSCFYFEELEWLINYEW